jgi:ABC-2 type transport system ATP-binding protein
MERLWGRRADLVVGDDMITRLQPTKWRHEQMGFAMTPATTTQPASTVLTVTHLRKTYGETTAVADVSFTLGHNEIVGLVGPNGAGKTTIINMILGVLEPSSGAIVVNGADIATQRSQALQQSNFAAVYAPLPGNLTVYQNLRIFGLIYGVDDLSQRIEVLLEEFELDRFRHVKCGVLSSGEQTRIGLAKAMINRPRLLLLDEPTASLDPAAARDIRARIHEFARQGSGGILWTSHNMYEVQDVCDRVLFLSHGRILLQGDPKTLPREHGKETLEELFVAVAREPLTLGIG